MTVTPLEFEWREWRLGEGRYRGLGPCSKPRPSRFPAVIPVAWWARLVLFLARRRKAPDPLAFWRSKGLFEAWGLLNGQFTPERLAEIAQARGIGWVAVLDSPAQRKLRDPLRKAFSDRGVKLVVWQTRPVTGSSAVDAIRFWGPDGYVAEIETYPVDGAETFAQTVAQTFPDLPRGIITSWTGAGATASGTYDVDEAKVWWSRGWACIPEAYAVNEHGPQPTLMPSVQDALARKLGYPESFPCCGIYRVPPSYYAAELLEFPHHSFYTAEYLPEAR